MFPQTVMPQLPLDLYIAILEALTPDRAQPDAVVTLVNCLETNSLLREAALQASVWEPHYRVRYQHIKGSEAQLKIRFNSNWRLMYAERRRQDRVALDLLDQMVLDRFRRFTHAATLTAMSFDIWDALEIECILPASSLFGASTTTYAITRRYWAEGVLNMILRSFAVSQWCKLANEGGQSLSFVDAFSYMSCFFGKTPQENVARILLKRESVLDPESTAYDLPGLCTEICRFMHEEQGFGPVEPTRFYDILNHFPHSYLTTNKRTLPISLVHVFVSLARHINISASPVEFPGRVLVHIPSPSGTDDFLVDVYGSALVSLRHDLPVMLLRLGIPPDNIERYVSPCGAAPMLLRAARNIFASLQSTNWPSQAAVYVTACIHFILSNEPQLIAHMLARVPPLDPLYCSTFLADLRPLLSGANAYLLEKCCADAMEKEAAEAAIINSRTAETKIQHYVGMIFEHRVHAYTGCIVGWDSVCAATAEWQARMHVDTLPRGAKQPFYQVVSLEGTQRYVAEDNIKPVELTAKLAVLFLEKVKIMSRYFSDAYTHPEAYRGRWCLSPELRRQYPDDEDFAQIYDEYKAE
ncbi:Hemimethylated DNA-binding protein YccV like-domain-containing protein [Mycena amicta]|nr:Hemimethylated DNA-binding protein YccV like-domain-containing protein [Mycena amicta]